MIAGVWMHKRAQRSSVDHQPSYESPKLRWREYVDLEHANRMGTDWAVPDTIDTEFGKFMADACPQFMGEVGLGFVSLWPVKVERVEPPGIISRLMDGERDVGMGRRESFCT